MLPFLKPKQVAGVIIEKRKADASKEMEPEDKENQELTTAAEDLIRAIHAKDAQGVATAIKACMDCASAKPEGDDYDAQNQKAAMESME